MSGSTESLRRKIAGAGDLEGVVRSMKALAASSIGQYEKAVESLHHYYRTIELGLSECLRQVGPVSSMPSRRKSEAIGAVVFGSDQGLVGQFNEVLMESTMNTLKGLAGETKKIWAVGERVQELFAGVFPSQTCLLSAPTSIDGVTPLVDQILIEIEAAREAGTVTEVYIFHNQPQSEATYEPVNKRLLPFDVTWRSTLAALPWPSKSLPEVLGGAEAALPVFIRGYLFVLLFQACAESLASENASRLASMQRAEKNIGDMLEELNRTFHRIRQESIDEELFDVVSGYEALSKGR
jgi:F-type H+-transporting ATPase subunit gamma